MTRIRYFILAAITALLACLASPVAAQTIIVATCGTPAATMAAGQAGRPLTMDVNGVLCTSVGSGGTASSFNAGFPSTGTAIGLSDGTNMKSWLAAIALADGVNGNNTGAVAGWFWNGTTYDRARSITGAVAAGTGTQAVAIAPTSSSAAATTSASSTAAASNLVLKASAGNLYNLTATIGATSGYLLLFDATALPSNGAVTPVLCLPVTSNGTNGSISLDFSTPKRFGTGITAGFSTTGCFTLTASATASFFGGYQ